MLFVLMEVIQKMNRLKLLSLAAVVPMVSVMAGSAVTANSDEIRPVFNYMTDLRFVIDDDKNTELRDEADFLRFGMRGELGNGDDVDFCSDQTLDLWFYVHNGTSERTNSTSGDWAAGNQTAEDFWNADNQALDGPAVAHNTTVRLEVPAETAGSHVVTASITSDESDAVADSVQIACADETKQVSLIYSEETTLLSTRAFAHPDLGGFNLRGDLSSETGAVLGYGDDGQGIVPSCWDFSAVIRGKLQIVVSDETTVEEPPEETPEEPETPEDTPEEIPRLGPAGAAPLAVVALSSALGATCYRAAQSRR